MLKYNEVAAKWWADKIRNISPSNFNSGDRMIDRIAYEKAIKESKMKNAKKVSKRIDAFEKLLAEEITKLVKSYGKAEFSCDYAPDQHLCYIANIAKIRGIYFPWKTTMVITREKVQVQYGNGSEYITIYPVKDIECDET